MKKTILLFSLSIIILSSCSKGFIGSGTIISEDRDLPSFHSIESSSSIDAYISYGEIQSIEIETDDNIIDKIITRVHNHVLEIETKRHEFSATTMTAYITIPRLEKVASTGSGDIEISGFEVLEKLTIDNKGSGDLQMNDYVEINHITIDNDGSGYIEIKGDFNNLNISNRGSGNIKAKGTVHDSDIKNMGSGEIYSFGLESNTCHLRNYGSGNAYITCQDKLVIDNKGSGDVYYKGHPSLTINNTGSGSVRNSN